MQEASRKADTCDSESIPSILQLAEGFCKGRRQIWPSQGIGCQADQLEPAEALSPLI